MYRAAMAALALTALTASPAGATERLRRTLAADEGLSSPTVNGWDQDDRGFMWLGTEVGLYRYDGRVLERWAEGVIDELVHWVVAGPGGRVVVVVRNKGVWEVTDDGVAPFPGPDGTQLEAIHRAEFAADGGLWITRDGAVLHVDANGHWGAPIELPGDHANVVLAAADGGAHVGGYRALWRITPAGVPQRLADLPGPVDELTPLRRGGLAFTATFSGKAYVYRDGALTLIAEYPNRAVNVVERGDRLWVSWDKHLGYVDPGKPARIFHVRDGGRLMVDREGSLWLSTFRGLVQFPEPDTETWTDADGLVSTHTRALARGTEGLWFNAWADPPYLLDEASGAVSVPVDDTDLLHGGAMCTDGLGAVWSGGDHPGLTSRSAGAFHHYAIEEGGDAMLCSRAADGRVWFATARGLHLVGGGAAPIAVPVPAAGAHTPYEASDGTLWLATVGESVCHGSAAEARAGRDPGWRCDDIPGAVHALDFVETEGGTLWLGTRQRGLLYRRGERWVAVPAAQQLDGRYIASLTRSPRGGVWITTPAAVVRVLEGDGPDAPWTVVERLGPWNGLMTSGASRLMEDADGTVWLTTSAGLTRVPASARDSRRPPPSVSLVDVRVRGHRYNPGDAVELPHGDNHIELAFSGPTYREPKLLIYRMRFGPERPWSAPTAQPVFNFVDLAPGRYLVEVVASLDGRTWSTAPASFRFSVARPWWLEPWAWVAGAVLLVALLLAIHRARLLVALRLERQRMRIAMDLHDEMGSGLGSIGLLASVAADAEPDTTRDIADKIVDTAADLGDSLTDIVWSLRPGSAEPASLARYLTEKGEALFPADRPAFHTELPQTWPRVQLSLPVLRNLQLIASEALHNAARHAHADNVRLGIDTGDRWWTLWIEDDGVGMNGNAEPRPGGGLGLDSMKKRAAEIGASLELAAVQASGAGTRTTIRFDPRARDRRIP